jgi:hypothetical protein
LKGGFRHDPNDYQNLEGTSANKDKKKKHDKDSEGEEDMDATKKA